MTAMQHKFLTYFSAILFTFIFAAVGCSAQQTEEQALSSLREMTREGKLPPESVVAGIESRFSGKRTGSLASLLRARIKYENKDFTGAAAILNSSQFKKLTDLGDYALWLRGRALREAGHHEDAIKAFETLINEFPDSIRLNEARLLWADSAILAGSAARVRLGLEGLNALNKPESLLLTAKAFDAMGDANSAKRFYRAAYFHGAGIPSAQEAETKLLALGESLEPSSFREAEARARNLFAARDFSGSNAAYARLAADFPMEVTASLHLDRLAAAAAARDMEEARRAFDSIPASAVEKERAFYEITAGYAAAKKWPESRQIAGEMKETFPKGVLTPKAWVDAGYAARDAKNKADESYFLRTALINFPEAIEVAGAQFETAWLEHEVGNFAKSSKLLIEHLARYTDRDTTNRGKAGYWAARDAERAGKLDEACVLYDALIYRYGANWYGYLGFGRLTALRGRGECRESPKFSPDSLLSRAAANLKTITVAPETAGSPELARAEKSDQLSTVGLFDWAIDELREARKTAPSSPKINLALARHYRMKGDNTNALIAMQKSYPDYAQMFPEEMGREEWSFFYPLSNWEEITFWAKQRNLDKYQVAGLIRQESVFNPRARSSANAFGLMQLLVPTARTMAKKYVSKTVLVTPDSLFEPPLNIELGTAFMRDQFDKFGRIEYVAVAYNAGPNRVPQWRARLPLEIDEFVEAIPFKETKGYVQGVIRNTAQYRRLYDDNGNFKPNVGAKPIRAAFDMMPREQFTAEFPDVKLDDGMSEEE